jgi:hypothetical protein
MSVRSTVLWDETQCSLIEVHQCFGETGLKSKPASSQQEAGGKPVLQHIICIFIHNLGTQCIFWQHVSIVLVIFRIHDTPSKIAVIVLDIGQCLH